MNMLQGMGRERQQMITDIFKKAQNKGEIRKDLNLDFIIFLMGKMASMIEDEELLNMFNSPTELIVELTAFYFYGMMPRTKHKE